MALACAAVSLAGCDKKPAAPAPATAATVTAPVKEAELTTIRLTPEAEKRLGITTVTVDKRPVPRTRNVGGEIVAPSGTALAITAPTSGVLQAPNGMPVAGNSVTKGQLLFRLVPLPATERESPVLAQQAIDTVTARRDAAAKKAQRAAQLLTDGAGSRRQLEEAQAELAVAEAELKAARDRRTLATRSGTTEAGVRLDAPQNGVVQAVHVREGQTVSSAAPLLDLVQLATVWIRVPIYAGESKDIDAKAPAHVLSLSDRPDADGSRAQSIAAPPSANPSTSAVDLYYAMSNSGQRFRPGERVSVRLTRRGSDAGVNAAGAESGAPAALVVPKAALLHDAYGGTWVYVARDPQVYARVRVVVADIVGNLALLSVGPPVNARVVIDGAAELFGVEFGVGK